MNISFQSQAKSVGRFETLGHSSTLFSPSRMLRCFRDCCSPEIADFEALKKKRKKKKVLLSHVFILHVQVSRDEKQEVKLE